VEMRRAVDVSVEKLEELTSRTVIRNLIINS
jgi:hypothetical protein